MKYATVRGLDKPVSRIVLGTMIVNTQALDASYRLMDDALATGCNTLDTAHGYADGDSERAIGRWMRDRANREDVVILTKGCHHNTDRKRVTPYDLAADLHDSLARLQTDYVDIYMLHRDDPEMPVQLLVEALNEHWEAGLIGAFGGSNWTHTRIREANDFAAANGLQPMTVSSPHFSLAEQIDNPWGPGCVGISGPAGAEARQWYEANDIPIFAYSSLARGFFSGRVTREKLAADPELVDDACRCAYCHEVNFERLKRVQALAAEKGLTVPQLAMAYVLNQPLQIHALVGATSGEELAACVAAEDVRLSAAEMAWLDLETETC